MQHFIRNTWEAVSGSEIEQAEILRPSTSPEQFFVTRYKWNGESEWELPPNGCFLSVISGHGQLILKHDGKDVLSLVTGCHVYHPAWSGSVFRAGKGTEVVCVAAPTKKQVRGERLIVRDEEFLASATTSSKMLRWKLTPQYLSRRIFLHHDETLLSGSGWPVSWFHTTMFDVAGLPKNEDGEPVFKMSYNYRSEFNVCIDVCGSARVRMARHPYVIDEIDTTSKPHHYDNSETETPEIGEKGPKKEQQEWDDWEHVNDQTTYHVNEAAGSDLEERVVDSESGRTVCFRNKHEVSISNGHVSLLCMFDPAPTGMEQHQPGSYSSYGPLGAVLGTGQHDNYIRELREFDRMVDKLSLCKARGTLSDARTSTEWDLYQTGASAQAHLERQLFDDLQNVGRGHVIAKWMRQIPVSSSPTQS